MTTLTKVDQKVTSRFWYHSINEIKSEVPWYKKSLNRWFHKRWFFHFEKHQNGKQISSKEVNFEISSGFKCKFEYQHGEASDNSATSQLTLGLFLFTIYFTFPLPNNWYLKKKCIATWKNNKVFYLIEGRDYGFYFYQWAFVWSFHAKPNESNSKDPWWMKQYIHIDEFFFGKAESIEMTLDTHHAPLYFRLGTKIFKLDEIKLKRRKIFRTFIPFALYHHTYHTMDIKCENPPMRAGKGENSWDCEPDGSYGLYGPYNGPKYTWKNRDEVYKYCCDHYVESTMNDAKKYGGSSSKRGIMPTDQYTYLGRQKQKEIREGNKLWHEPIEGQYQFGNDLQSVKEDK